MKKVLVVVILCVMFVLSASADMIIGRCSFKGKQPPRIANCGGVVIYYYEMSSMSESRGGTEYKKCSGDVWVIYKKASDVKRIQVETTNGTVQVCCDF